MCHWAGLTSTRFGCTSILWAGFGYSSQSWVLVEWADIDYLGPSPPQLHFLIMSSMLVKFQEKKINNYIINQMFKFQIFAILNYA